jgi:chromosome segregation ATPase
VGSEPGDRGVWTVDALKEYVDALRDSDREAVALAHQDLSKRLEGFPQQFATKQEMDGASEALQRLEKDSINREIYDTNQKTLEALAQKLDRDKLSHEVFQSFLQSYRAEQEAAATERRDVAAALATAAARQKGSSATWGQIGATLAGIVAFLTIVVIVASYAIQ